MNLIKDQVSDIVQDKIRFMLQLLEEDAGGAVGDTSVSGFGYLRFITNMVADATLETFSNLVTHTTCH